MVFLLDTQGVPRDSRSYWSELLLRYGLRQLGFTGPLEIERGPYGKPFLVGTKTPFFSISHSASLLACGIGKEEVGLDLQRVRKDYSDRKSVV